MLSRVTSKKNVSANDTLAASEIVDQLSTMIETHQDTLVNRMQSWNEEQKLRLDKLSQQMNLLIDGQSFEVSADQHQPNHQLERCIPPPYVQVARSSPPAEAAAEPGAHEAPLGHSETQATEATVRFEKSEANVHSGSESDNMRVRSARSSVTRVIDKMRAREVSGTGLFEGSEPKRLASKFAPRSFASIKLQGMTCKALIRTDYFEALCAFVILVNAIVIGVQTEIAAQSDDESTILRVFGHVINGWYLLELLLRVWSSGIREWCTSKEDRYWNYFDLFLVVLWLLDFAIDTEGMGLTKIKAMLRTLRMFRVMRILRIFRFLRAIREFRKMIYACSASVSTLMWSILLLFFEIYFFSICLMLAVVDFKKDYPEQDSSILDQQWGSISKAYYSSFMSISAGIAWGEVLDPLLVLSPNWFFGGIFLFFISVTLFGVLNVLTAVFVESAMTSTERSREIFVNEKEYRKALYVEHIKEIFYQIDEDGSGEISIEEVEKIFEDEAMSKLLEALEIEALNAYLLFKLLDTDESGSVDIEEFCDGCLRLKGNAKSFDIQCLMYENQRLLTKVRIMMGVDEENKIEMTKLMESHFKQSSGKLNTIIRRLTTVSANMGSAGLTSEVMHVGEVVLEHSV